MDTIIIFLLGLSIVLFIISFFQTDKVKVLEKEVEQLSMNVLQDHYLMKKRLKVLEEELLMGQNFIDDIPRRELDQEPNEILKNHVLALYNQGLEIQQISKQSSLSVETVKNIIKKRQGTIGGI
ncbi:hypothetical protein ACFFF5_01050 [Lederbergia wuyishanensis]|uniref:Resolvase HTH domain-containing protein n=1 Tax=Lederbergia wuyishanensis TaxID=1347903 RepID=A0ABU0D1G4_9BACI|nr:hypothetical protein [Lederbergia wuyishanensis]MCJ8006835.1 hypothetical protein [Lederbergia wuyishanensis]MDQ0342219.1 hypothetical protein [Lederbergia wuyishanensis]